MRQRQEQQRERLQQEQQQVLPRELGQEQLLPSCHKRREQQQRSG